MDRESLVEGLRKRFTGPLSIAGSHRAEDLHDESLHPRHREPLAVARPRTTGEVVELVKWANESGVAITPRGSGTGLSGAATPIDGGLVIAFDHMNEILEIDEKNAVAVVQPGVTLAQLDDSLSGTRLRYSVYPGETSGSIGGNVNTNAGGMRAVRYGVTRQHVLGLEVVTADARVVRTGGRVVKTSSGYDLTQLIVGSEGTLALVTEATLRLTPRYPHSRALLVAFGDSEPVGTVVSEILASGVEPTILEFLDGLTLASITQASGVSLGLSAEVEAAAAAFLLIVLECRTADQLDADAEFAVDLVEAAGALETYGLDARQGAELVAARERVFWVAKAAGANDIIDVVVPRADVPHFLKRAVELATSHGVFIAGCGHVGDGNVHLSVYQPDDEARERFLVELYSDGLARGGAISGEHGIGLDKMDAYVALTDPVLLELQRSIKSVFDPRNILNPGRHQSP